MFFPLNAIKLHPGENPRGVSMPSPLQLFYTSKLLLSSVEASEMGFFLHGDNTLKHQTKG
jgi:hypothetical protein